jgi:hypothetical protein
MYLIGVVVPLVFIMTALAAPWLFDVFHRKYLKEMAEGDSPDHAPFVGNAEIRSRMAPASGFEDLKAIKDKR